MDLTRTINNATPMFPDNFKRALEEFDQNDDGLIDYNEFKQINRRYPMMLYPAFSTQERMQTHCLGLCAQLLFMPSVAHRLQSRL